MTIGNDELIDIHIQYTKVIEDIDNERRSYEKMCNSLELQIEEKDKALKRVKRESGDIAQRLFERSEHIDALMKDNLRLDKKCRDLVEVNTILSLRADILNSRLFFFMSYLERLEEKNRSIREKFKKYYSEKEEEIRLLVEKNESIESEIKKFKFLIRFFNFVNLEIIFLTFFIIFCCFLLSLKDRKF